MMMKQVFIVFLLFIGHAFASVKSDCPFFELCEYNQTTSEVICDGQHRERFPPTCNIKPVKNYSFANYRILEENAFHNMLFLENALITMRFTDFTSIQWGAFSSALKLPATSNLSIIIENKHYDNLAIGSNAFSNVRIQKLEFRSIRNFNETSMFNTRIFGDNVTIDTLVIRHSQITGFLSDDRLAYPVITNLLIQHCSSLTNLTKNNLPAIPNTKTLEISDTGLETIEEKAFEGWKYIFSSLIIRNNKNLRTFPLIVSGRFFLLKTLDLTGNSIASVDPNYDWSRFYTTENLILGNQSQLNIFLQSNILTQLTQLKSIDFSHSRILTSDTNFIPTYVPKMPLLASVNLSYTNFTSEMLGQLLNIISKDANRTTNIETVGYRMNDTDFCSYYQVFYNAPNSIRIEFDKTQQCNCIVDLFYIDQVYRNLMNDSLPDPVCLFNKTRERCNTQNQFTLSGCTLPNPTTDPPNTSLIGSIGPYAFAGTMGGLFVVLLVLLAAGSSFIYRARRSRRRGTILRMDDPFDTQSIMYVEDRDDVIGESSTDAAEPAQPTYVEHRKERKITEDTAEVASL